MWPWAINDTDTAGSISHQILMSRYPALDIGNLVKLNQSSIPSKPAVQHILHHPFLHDMLNVRIHPELDIFMQAPDGIVGEMAFGCGRMTINWLTGICTAGTRL